MLQGVIGLVQGIGRLVLDLDTFSTLRRMKVVASSISMGESGINNAD